MEPAKKRPRQFQACTYWFAVERRAGRGNTPLLQTPSIPPEARQYCVLIVCGTVLRVASSPSVNASSPTSVLGPSEMRSPARCMPCGRMVTGPRSAESMRPVEKIRSEEHTSELQSQFHLVCRLLLEKKKNKQ